MTSKYEVIVEGDLGKLPPSRMVEADLEYPDRVIYDADEYETLGWGLEVVVGGATLLLNEKHIDNVVVSEVI